MKKNAYLAFPLCILFLAGCKKEITQNDALDEGTSVSKASGEFAADKYKPNEILVKFKSVLSETGKSSLLSQVNGNIARKLFTRAMKNAGNKDGIYVINTSLNVEDAINKLKKFSEVEFAEPNFIYQHNAVSNDPYYTNGSLWGMYSNNSSPANKFGSRAAKAWANGHTGSASVYVAVIDEGAMYNHTDLSGQFWVNPYDPVDGVDNDGNGYIDDIRGWDFVSNDNTTFDGTTDDHGTHVSGTIGAKGGNGIGVAGVNWSITIINAKFLGSGGGTTENAILAVDYVTDLKTSHGLNIVATNNSWGGGGFSQGLKDAIERANDADILFVAAAGNGYGNNNDASPYYPASYTNSNIIAVASIRSNGKISNFSNYGATAVDLGAPGSEVYSTLPGSGGTSTYGSYDGTSMATPHVCGAAALYLSTHPGSSAATIKNAILNATIATTSLSGKCVTGGRLNMQNF